MNLLTQTLYSGLMSGAVYALLGIGLVLAYRTSRVLNLTHGESYVAAALTCAVLSRNGVPLWVAMAAGLAASVVLAIVVERFLLRPRAEWPLPSLILLTLAAAFVAKGAFLVMAGADPLSFERLLGSRPIRFAGGALPWQGALLIGVSLIVTTGLTLFLTYTPIGRRLRASAENPDAAQIMGINVPLLRSLAFGISGGLAGLAALLLVPMVSVDFQAGLGMTMRAFIAAALAGMSPSRTMLTGFGLGLFEAGVTSYAGALAQDPVVFAVLIAIALWQSRRIRFGGSVRA
jgi:branched-subunit amino acid ABC-type transport system permease component